MKRISIVVPAYNEAENIPLLHAAVSDVFVHIPYELELLFVNDGSTDTTQAVLEALHTTDGRVQYVTFTKNYGQQAATAAGLGYARGDAVMLMDADLQHPPHRIPEFIHLWEQGNQMVFGVRRTRVGESAIRVGTSRLFGLLASRKFATQLPPDTSDFCILDRSIVAVFTMLPPSRVATRVRLGQIPGQRAFVPYAVEVRAAGTRKYTPLKLVTLFFTTLFGDTKKIAHTPIYTIATTSLPPRL